LGLQHGGTLRLLWQPQGNPALFILNQNNWSGLCG